MLTRPCPICGAKPAASEKIGTLKKTVGERLSHDNFDLVRCPSCELIMLQPLPTEADFGVMYVEFKAFSTPVYRGERVNAVLQHYGGRWKFLMKSIAKGAPVRVLEVGAGLAWICRVAKLYDPLSVTVAQDVTAQVVEECREWVDSYVVDWNVNTPLITALAPFDVISMTHVIEHLPDPVSMLKQCASLLDPNGCIFVTAPHRPEGWSSASPIAKWQAWSYNHVPAHLQYFSETAMTKAANLAGQKVFSWFVGENGQSFEAILRHISP